MTRISASKYVDGVESIYDEQPEYVEGHDGSDGTCDCIGMCRGGMQRGGVPKSEITNMRGTNQAARKTIQTRQDLTSESQLTVGDVVMKTRDKDDPSMPLPDKYRKGGSDYDPTWGETNFTHIGTVTELQPLVITHMTSPTAKKDKSIKGWLYFGKLPWVDQSDPGPGPGPEPEPPEVKTATVWSENGKPVNTRKGPDESYPMSKAGKIPVGEEVQVDETTVNSQGETWCKCEWTDSKGAHWVNFWIKKDFLIIEGPEPPAGMYTVIVPGLTEEQADKLIQEYPGAYKTVG